MDCKVLPQWPTEHFTCSGADPSDDCIKIVLKTSAAARTKSISWNNCIAKAQKLKIKEIKRGIFKDTITDSGNVQWWR